MRQGLHLYTKKENFFRELISEYDQHSYHNSLHYHAHKFLGAHKILIKGEEGIRFVIWAPKAKAVSLVGDFNNWSPNASPMYALDEDGLWINFIPRKSINSNLDQTITYQFAIHSESGVIEYINDPFARELGFTKLGNFYKPKYLKEAQHPERYASVFRFDDFIWSDDEWIAAREPKEWSEEAISILKFDLSNNIQPSLKTYQQLAAFLTKEAKRLGFTHILFTNFLDSILDLTKSSEHYKSIFYHFFSPNNAFGNLDDFKTLINHLHQNQLGIIIELPYLENNCHLMRSSFKKEIQNFFFSNLVYWLEDFHIDGFYFPSNLDQKHLTRDFIQSLNEVLHLRSTGVFTIINEKNQIPFTTKPTYLDGWGFNMSVFDSWQAAFITSLQTQSNKSFALSLMPLFAENSILDFSLIDFMNLNLRERIVALSVLFALPGKKLIDFSLLQKLTQTQSSCSLMTQLYDIDLQEIIEKSLINKNHSYRQSLIEHETDFKDNHYMFDSSNPNAISITRWSKDFQDKVYYSYAI